MRSFVCRLTFLGLVLVVLIMATSPAFAGWKLFGRRSCSASAYPAQCQTAPVQAASVVPVVPTGQVPGMAAQQPAATATAGVTSGDAYGFLAWLNATRARYGLGAVGWDAAVEADCRQNNFAQAARGMGHWHMGCHRRQNAAAGLSFPGVEAAWLASPGHASALLDPGISRVAIAWYGAYATFGAN